MATQPLENVEGGRQWSLERPATMRVCREECARVLVALPKLLAVAKEVLPQEEPAATLSQPAQGQEVQSAA
jgi:hypothetical protein